MHGYTYIDLINIGWMEDMTIFDRLYASSNLIKKYFLDADCSWGEGYFTMSFKGKVSQVVIDTISCLIFKRFQCKLSIYPQFKELKL